jgi:anti-anti-sigma regulatory factor
MKVTFREVKDVVIFDIEGDYVRPKSPRTTLYQLVKTQWDKRKIVLLNLEKLKFIDSYGIEEVITIYITAGNIGGKINLACLPKRFRLLFEVCSEPPWGFYPEAGGVYETVEAALEILTKD